MDIRKSKDKARNMINKGEGQRIPTTEEKAKRPTRAERTNTAVQLRLSELEDEGNAIKMNLLGKSGLVSNRVVRDLNILESGIKQAADDLRSDELQPALDHHFGLDNLKDDKRKSQADGCTIAALLLMNAAMLHQRISNGRWLTGVSDLDTVKNDVNVVRRVRREWGRILTHDFRPVLEPAVKVIDASRGHRQASRARTGATHHRRRSGTHRRNLRRHGRRPRWPTVQPRDGQPSLRRRILHTAGGRCDRRPPDPRRLR